MKKQKTPKAIHISRRILKPIRRVTPEDREAARVAVRRAVKAARARRLQRIVAR